MKYYFHPIKQRISNTSDGLNHNDERTLEHTLDKSQQQTTRRDPRKVTVERQNEIDVVCDARLIGTL